MVMAYNNKYNTAAHRRARKWVRGQPCAHCGTYDDITADHIISLEQGGSSTMDNYQPLCRPCNTWKRNLEARVRDSVKRGRRRRWRNNAY